jgi:predicted  nucleic acid-binding Zn-ribbon protein
MERTETLYRLQVVDLEIDEKTRRLHAVESSLGESPVLIETRQRYEAARAVLTESRRKLRDHELQVQELVEKIARLEAEMYGGRIVNPKELAGMEQDGRHLRTRKSQLEDAVLELMLAVEQQEREAATQRTKLAEVEQQWQAEQVKLGQEEAGLREHLAELEATREERRQNIAAADLVVYDELRRKKGGRGVAVVKGLTCGGCGVTLPTGEVQRSHTSDVLVFCSSCGRILHAGG